MATATKKVLAVRPVARGVGDVFESASLESLVYRDNGGDYHWEIVGGSSESLAQSGSFASHDDGEHAARCVYAGAGSARFEPHLADERQFVAV